MVRNSSEDKEKGSRKGKKCMLLSKKQKRAYAEFYRSARNNEILDARTTLMIHLAAALAIGCYP